MAEISMSGRLPAGDGNGLSAIADSLIRDDDKLFVCIAIVDASKVVINKDTGERVPTARIRRIEVVQDAGDLKVARRLMVRALDQRTGRESLPYDLEAEVASAFGSESEDDYRDEPPI